MSDLNDLMTSGLQLGTKFCDVPKGRKPRSPCNLAPHPELHQHLPVRAPIKPFEGMVI